MKYLAVIILTSLACFFAAVAALGTYGYKATQVERTATPISVVVQTAPSTSTQPAPAPSNGQKTAGRSDLEWAGTIVTPLFENGKLAGAQLRARFPIKPNSAEWIDRLDFNGTNGVDQIPQGEVGTVWIRPAWRANQ